MEDTTKKEFLAMYRRWAYMIVAIIATIILLHVPVFSFRDDKGIFYIRSFSMDQTTFYVTQTEIKTGAEEVTATMSVAGLYYCAKAILYLCIITLLCFFNKKWRMTLCVVTAVLAGAYYIVMVYYAMKMTDTHYTTLSPTIYAVLPAIVLQLMLLVRRNVASAIMAHNENEETEE
jgi:peptidoglycan/LPS O-acetylase OafA/YrhL